jgi:hypothetical protein
VAGVAPTGLVYGHVRISVEMVLGTFRYDSWVRQPRE